jgi:hypothetical protein
MLCGTGIFLIYWTLVLLISSITCGIMTYRLDGRLQIPGRTATVHRRRDIRRTILTFMILSVWKSYHLAVDVHLFVILFALTDHYLDMLNRFGSIILVRARKVVSEEP